MRYLYFFSKVKVLFLFFIFIIQVQSSFCQLPVFKREQRMLKIADKHYQEKDYVKAIEKYRDYISRYEGNVDVWYRIAIAFKETGRPERSEIYYNRIIKTDEQANPIVHLSLGQVLMMQSKYSEARKHFQRYNELLEYNDQLAMRYISSIENIDKYFVDSSFFVKSNLPINSEASDFGAVAYNNDFYFLSTRNTKDDFNLRYSSDLFVSNMDSEGALFENPKKMSGPANTRFGEIGYAIVPGTNEIFICRYEPGKEDEYSLGYNLYKAYLGADKAITRPERFTNDKFKYAIAYPTLSYNGKFIIFSSDAPGGYGGWDLYRAEFTDLGFDNIHNLGDKINSAGDELYPYLLNDSILFFATDGHGGIGGFDIYSKNMKNSDEFSRNMGYPINSPGDDIGIYLDSGLSGYFTSNREGGKGSSDIYKFKIHQLKLSGEVVDELNGENLKNVNIKIKRSSGAREALALADNGTLILEASPGEELEITVEKEGYETKSFSINTAEMAFVGSHSMQIGKLPVLKIEEEVEPITFEIAPEIIKETKPGKYIFFGVQLISSKSRISDESLKKRFPDQKDISEYFDGKYYRYLIGKNESYFLSKEVFKKNKGKNKTYLVAFIENESERVMKALKIAHVEPAEARDPIVHEFIDKTNQVGSEIVYYGLDKFRIPEGVEEKLNFIVNELNAHPDYFLEIAAHTDKRGSDMYNRALSEERAKFLSAYFVSKGIGENRIIHHGIGEKQLKKYCADCTEADHEQNRRAELILRVYKQNEEGNNQ
jgi:outer membrane protein OmpA-like peptidoglycan-associated protein/tetratricopeptide (TPR) repeat protein